MSRAFSMSASLIALVAALAVVGCRHEPEQTASAKPPVNDLPEVQPAQGSQPQAGAVPPTAMSTPTETAPAPAPAQTASSGRQPCDTGAKPAQLADANSDGKVTKEEANVDPNLVAVFDQYDQDEDGILSREEFQQIVDDAQKKHPDRAEFAKAEGSEPCPDEQERRAGKTEPQT